MASRITTDCVVPRRDKGPRVTLEHDVVVEIRVFEHRTSTDEVSHRLGASDVVAAATIPPIGA